MKKEELFNELRKLETEEVEIPEGFAEKLLERIADEFSKILLEKEKI